MKIVAINSSLSAYKPERAILVGQRIRGMSNKAYAPPRQVSYPVGKRMGYHEQYAKLDRQVMEGQKFTPNEKARRSPFKRYE